MSLAPELGGFSWGNHADGRESPVGVTNTRVITTREGYPVRVQDILDLATEIRNSPEVNTNDEVLIRWGQPGGYPQLVVVARR